MGFMSKVKGFLNIGGVKVKITQVEDPFPRGDSVMKGKFQITTGTDRTVLSASARFYKETTKKGDDGKDKTEQDQVGRWSSKDYMLNEEYPFELAANETRELDFFMTDVKISEAMADQKGVMGALGKASGWLSKIGGEKIGYFIEVTVDVKDTPFDPSDKVPVNVVESRK